MYQRNIVQSQKRRKQIKSLIIKVMKKELKRIIVLLLCIVMFSLSACQTKKEEEGKEEVFRYEEYAKMSEEEILASLTLEEKAAQMVQPACYKVNPQRMRLKDYGSILSNNPMSDARTWQDYIIEFQEAAILSESGIPFIFGQDDVHGVNYCVNAVYFPHNIGLGAANDPDLMYRIGEITADEAKICRMLWNFAPCIAQSVDPRWGRTYESYGSDLEMIKELSVAYTRGLQDNGLLACAKHYIADGNVLYGTGEDSDTDRLIDRGDARLSEEEIKDLLAVYQAQIDAGVKTIMVSHSALNGVKMHENKEFIEKLKNEMGFEGFIVSDWNAIQNTSKTSYYDQVVTAIDAGIDMLMEVDRFDKAIEIIVAAVNKGELSKERIDDAVLRILKVKKELGVFEDPLFDDLQLKAKDVGSDAYRQVAKEAVEKSLVLIKNEGELLPLKEGTKIYITGPAADNDSAQCGGWTLDWNRSPVEDIPGVTSIREGLIDLSKKHKITICEDPKEADVILLAVGEEAYAEWNGDSENIDICGPLGLKGNKEAIEEARTYGKPIVTLLVAGRHVFISDYINDWNSVVMCYLPGSEGEGVASVLFGEKPFNGKLPSNWYASNEGIEKKEAWLKIGYGLTGGE